MRVGVSTYYNILSVLRLVYANMRLCCLCDATCTLWICVLTADDIPGENDVSPVTPSDPVFAKGLVEYVGQSLFAVVAESLAVARLAACIAVGAHIQRGWHCSN